VSSARGSRRIKIDAIKNARHAALLIYSFAGMSFNWQRWLLTSLRFFALVALVFSVALFVHYLDPANSGYCSGKSGCEAVRRSGYSYFFGLTYLNFPLLGVVSFSAVLTLSFVPMPVRLRAQLLGGAAVVGAVLALGFIGLQAFAIGAFCWLCMVVDSAAVIAGVCGALLFRYRDVAQREALKAWSLIAIGALFALAPIALWQTKPPPPIPPAVLALYQPGKINVVEFADYQCPYCRTMYTILKRLNREFGDKVNFHQLHMPLPNHEHALGAAAAAVCAERQGKGREMKDLLFTAHLDEDAAEQHASALALDLGQFRTCVKSSETSKRINDDKQILMKAEFRGLPTTFIGNQRIVGWRLYPALKEAYEAALRDSAPLSLPNWLFWSLFSAVLLALAYLGRLGAAGKL
jgi:protein-disulfide isomerase/uncharacterized membrane protein